MASVVAVTIPKPGEARWRVARWKQKGSRPRGRLPGWDGRLVRTNGRSVGLSAAGVVHAGLAGRAVGLEAALRHRLGLRVAEAVGRADGELGVEPAALFAGAGRAR